MIIAFIYIIIKNRMTIVVATGDIDKIVSVW